MNIVVQKSDEDELLSTCDNTCDNSEQCVVKRIIKFPRFGQAMSRYGLGSCLLCYRASGKQPFVTLVSGYPEDWVVGDSIRFKKDDYGLTESGLVQLIENSHSPVVDNTWVTKIYKCVTERCVEIPWRLAICENPHVEIKSTRLSIYVARQGRITRILTWRTVR